MFWSCTKHSYFLQIVIVFELYTVFVRSVRHQIIQQIENLKGRRSYEEKRAAKLGFASLYAYFEHKHQKSALAAEAATAQLERFKIEKELALKAKAEKKKGCGCC